MEVSAVEPEIQIRLVLLPTAAACIRAKLGQAFFFSPLFFLGGLSPAGGRGGPELGNWKLEFTVPLRIEVPSFCLFVFISSDDSGAMLVD